MMRPAKTFSHSTFQNSLRLKRRLKRQQGFIQMTNMLRREAALWASLAMFSLTTMFTVVTTIFMVVTPAFSQAPTDAQRSAIRSECRSDYEAHCASIPPGGAASLQCLQKNMSSLSPGCQTAVRAVEAPAAPKAESAPAPAAAPAKPAAETAAPAPAPKAAARGAVGAGVWVGWRCWLGVGGRPARRRPYRAMSGDAGGLSVARLQGRARPVRRAIIENCAHEPPAVRISLRDRRLLAAKGEDQLDQSDGQSDVAERHRDLIGGMPIQLCELIEAVEEIQGQKADAEQLDAAANQAMTQITEQNDRRFVARDMGSRRYDQCRHDHPLDIREYFLAGFLDMLTVEGKPLSSDIPHGFSLRQRSASDGLDLSACSNNDFPEFYYTGSHTNNQ